MHVTFECFLIFSMFQISKCDISTSISREMSGDLKEGMLAIGRFRFSLRIACASVFIYVRCLTVEVHPKINSPQFVLVEISKLSQMAVIQCASYQLCREIICLKIAVKSTPSQPFPSNPVPRNPTRNCQERKCNVQCVYILLISLSLVRIRYIF